MSDFPTYLIGSVEYVRAQVSGDVELEDQPVVLVIAGTEYPAAWVGDAGTTRIAQTTSAIDFTTWKDDLYDLAVKYTDTPEAPKVDAGYIRVKQA